MEDYSLIQFVPLDRTNERSIERVLALIDNTIQFGEDADVKTHVGRYNGSGVDVMHRDSMMMCVWGNVLNVH